jgi:hypothetical protein
VNLLPPPGPERRRQLILLAVLGVAAAISLWYTFGRSTTPTAAAPAAASNPAASPQAGPVPTPEPVKLAELEPVADEPVPGRNPFRFGQKPAPPPPPPPPTPVYTPPPPPPPPPPPQVPIKYVGQMTDPATGKRMANVKDPATGTQYLVVDGTIIDGKYRVVTVGNTSVVIEFIDGTGRRTIGG